MGNAEKRMHAEDGGQEHDSAPHRPHSARNHWITYVTSLMLTAISFVAVGTGSVSRNTVGWLILLLAVVQALFQAYVWMHLDQKGHRFPILAMASGFGFCLIMAVSFIYWVWF